jgi:hypothetical protein
VGLRVPHSALSTRSPVSNQFEKRNAEISAYGLVSNNRPYVNKVETASFLYILDQNLTPFGQAPQNEMRTGSEKQAGEKKEATTESNQIRKISRTEPERPAGGKEFCGAQSSSDQQQVNKLVR